MIVVWSNAGGWTTRGCAGGPNAQSRVAKRGARVGTGFHWQPRPSISIFQDHHSSMANPNIPPKALKLIASKHNHAFAVPVKRINDGDDVSFFLASKAYTDIITFIFQLNASMFPQKTEDKANERTATKEWKLQDSNVSTSPAVENLAKLLETLGAIVDEVPPDLGPRRFGNISFRKWYELVEERISDLLDEHLPSDIVTLGSTAEVSAKTELQAYLIGSFGSAQRLDYGTGHELSFLAFLASLWKLGAFPETKGGDQERAIVLGVIEPYVLRILLLQH
jgi:serine/threonine-protein phosphatase 2A activator